MAIGRLNKDKVPSSGSTVIGDGNKYTRITAGTGNVSFA